MNPELTGDPESSPQLDATILAQVRKADPQALELLFNTYSRMVYSVALRVLRDPSAAEDVMQDVFIQIWRKPDGYIAARGSVGAWLAVTARNKSIDVLRQRKMTDSVEDKVLLAANDVHEQSERKLLIERIRLLAGSLPRDQRIVLEMAYFEGATHSEIAGRTGIPLGTVKTRIRTALMNLGKALRR
jgi:RNA polymerase sigma-70 factor (ECF subfamily)